MESFDDFFENESFKRVACLRISEKLVTPGDPLQVMGQSAVPNIAFLNQSYSCNTSDSYWCRGSGIRFQDWAYCFRKLGNFGEFINVVWFSSGFVDDCRYLIHRLPIQVGKFLLIVRIFVGVWDNRRSMDAVVPCEPIPNAFFCRIHESGLPCSVA